MNISPEVRAALEDALKELRQTTSTTSPTLTTALSKVCKGDRGGSVYRSAIGQQEDSFNESEVEPILEKARVEGAVTEFDTGRRRIVWFQGTPGKALREVRRQVLSKVPTLQLYHHVFP